MLTGRDKTVIIPLNNVKDLQEIPDNIKGGLTIIPVSTIDDVLKVSLTKLPTPIPFEEFDPSLVQSSASSSESAHSPFGPLTLIKF